MLSQNNKMDILDKLATEVDKLGEEDNGSSSKTTDKDAKSGKSGAMSGLLEANPVRFPQMGDTVSGKVIDISSNAIYVDIEPFGTGIILGREMKDGMSSSKLKIGDEVSATVIDSENEDGYIELSIREASYEKAWEDLERKITEQEKVSTKVLSANKGGLLIEVNGITGFLPVSQLSSKNYPRVEDGDKNKILALLKRLVGQELTVRVIDADRETQKLIVSEKAAQKEKDRETISNLKIGDVVEGEISGVVDFGAFIKFFPPEKDPATLTDEDLLEGLVHISELAWQLIEDPRDIVKVGSRIKAKIIGIDNDKISLSIRALEKDPWSKISKDYKVGDIVEGIVHKINHFGAFVYLNKDIHGLAHISEMSEAYPGKNIEELLKTGENYKWKILSIEPKEHRMGLVLSSDKTEKVPKEKKETKKTKKEKPAEKDAEEKVKEDLPEEVETEKK